jgi:outer membrane protein assembly factor BamB
MSPAAIAPSSPAPEKKSSDSSTIPLAGGGGSFALPQYEHVRGHVPYNQNDATSGITLTFTNSGSNNLLGAPAPPNGTVAVYLSASIAGASSVAFSSGSNTMTLTSDTFQPGARYEVYSYEGSQEDSSVPATLERRTLTFQTPLSAISIPSGTPLAIEVVLVSSATPTPSPAADWDSFGYDLGRSGYNPIESSVGTNNVGTLQSIWTFNIGSNPAHEPVYAANVSVNGQATNVLYGGSSYGSTMYAVNAETGALIWSDPVPYSTFSCSPSEQAKFSIGETPAIDRKKNLLYFADGDDDVHAVDLGTGKEAYGWPIQIADYTPDHNFMHGGLTYNPANQTLYAVTGSTCDISPWYGRIVAIKTKGPRVEATFFTMSGNSSQGPSGGGIWGPGGGSIDPATNDVFVATGNADTTMGAAQNAGYAEEVIDLTPSLQKILANNYPTNIPTVYGDDDFDFGATPLLFQPPGCPPLLAAINKSGAFELYDRESISYGPIQYIYMSVPTDRGEFVGLPAYDPVTNYVYVGLPTTEGIYQPGMAAFSIQSNCTLNPTPAWTANFGPDGSPSTTTRRSPITIANGVVYISNYNGDTEFAFNAATGAQLWTAPLSSWGTVGAVVANGIVYVGSDDGTITAWAPSSYAAKLRKRTVKTRYSKVAVHRSEPRSPWGPWR